MVLFQVNEAGHHHTTTTFAVPEGHLKAQAVP